MVKNRKRSHGEFEEEYALDNPASGSIGVGAILANLKAPELAPSNGHIDARASLNGKNDARLPEDGGWIQVSKGSRHRQNKKQKELAAEVEVEAEDGSNDPDKYPILTYSEIHKLATMTKLGEMQDLVLYCLADTTAPKWVAVRHHAAIQKAVVLLVPGLEKGMFDRTIPLTDPNTAEQEVNEAEARLNESRSRTDVATQTSERINARGWANATADDYMPFVLDYNNLAASLQPLSDIFIHLWPIKTPGDDKYSRLYSPLHSMLTSPITKSREDRNAIKKNWGAKLPTSSRDWENEPTPINEFLTSQEDLQGNDYTLHPATFENEEEKLLEAKRREVDKQTAEDGWIDTTVNELNDGDMSGSSTNKGDLTAGRTVFAMDCEMCTVEGGEAALTRISLVGWDGAVIMDELVKPDKPITDYLTPYSGMTATKLNPITSKLSDIQSRLVTLLTPHTILIGHSLNSDLTALKLTHPFIIDTSLLYPHPRGPPLKSSLKWLAQKYLSREIQKGHGATGHDSIEDARACLDLVRMKCEKGPRWGSVDAERESIFKRLARAPKATAVTGADPGKQGAIVDNGTPEKSFGQMAAYSIGCRSDAEVVEGVCRAVNGDADGAYIPGGGVELTWARFRELEALRGWQNDNRSHSISSTTAADPSLEVLDAAVKQTVEHIKAVHECLPPRTLFLVYSGTGDPRDLARMQDMHRKYKKEFATKKWDELSVKWTDTEEQELKRACRKARKGIGFVCVK